MKMNNLQGLTFGELTVQERVGTNKNGSVVWSCLCTCGRQADVAGSYMLAGHTSTCGKCRSGQVGVARTAQLARLHKNNIKVKAPRNFVLSQYRHSAKRRNLVFTLTDEIFDTLIAGDCYWCGGPPSNRHTSDAGYSISYNGIDRLNPDIGYDIENCVSCCAVCNFMKSDLTLEQFNEKIVLIYKKHHQF
jgi:hypothetical protein